jgi:hypothetical protein
MADLFDHFVVAIGDQLVVSLSDPLLCKCDASVGGHCDGKGVWFRWNFLIRGCETGSER